MSISKELFDSLPIANFSGAVWQRQEVKDDSGQIWVVGYMNGVLSKQREGGTFGMVTVEFEEGGETKRLRVPFQRGLPAEGEIVPDIGDKVIERLSKGYPTANQFRILRIEE